MIPGLWNQKQEVGVKNERRIHTSKDRDNRRKEKLRAANRTAVRDQESELPLHSNTVCTKTKFWQRGFYTTAACQILDSFLHSWILEIGSQKPGVHIEVKQWGRDKTQIRQIRVTAFLEELCYPEGVTN